MGLHYSSRFRKQYKKLAQHLRGKVQDRIALLVRDEFHPILNNHQLHKEYEGCQSINITGDWRVVYEKYSDGTFNIMEVGTHSELYGS